MSKVIAGILTLVGTLFTLYFTFVMINTSWALDYNDPKLHQSMFQTGHFVPLVAGILMLTVGLTFFFVAKEPNPDIKP
jgi:low temperature requirement protein LtrA